MKPITFDQARRLTRIWIELGRIYIEGLFDNPDKFGLLLGWEDWMMEEQSVLRAPVMSWCIECGQSFAIQHMIHLDTVHRRLYPNGLGLLDPNRYSGYSWCPPCYEGGKETASKAHVLEGGARRSEPLSVPADAYAKIFRHEIEELYRLTCSKNQDYANADDALQNFSLVERLTQGKITTLTGIFTRLTDKIQRLANLLCGKTPNYESITDNAQDAAVYSLILKIQHDIERCGGWEARLKEIEGDR